MDSQQIAELLLYSSNLLAFPFERNFELTPFVAFARANVRIPVIMIGLYVCFCFLGQKMMLCRRAFDLRLPLAIWNALLCTFSFVGMCRTMPVLIANILTQDYEETICAPPQKSWANGVSGFWVMLFIFSKVPELVDTAFIVLRKKPLIFLHWYHHVTVLLFCWNSYATMSGSGLYFVAMHYTVHTLMYGYYCLLALNLCPKSFPSFLLTFAQIGQMFIGTFVCVSGWYFKYAQRWLFASRYEAATNATAAMLMQAQAPAQGPAVCHNSLSNLTAGALMFGCYIYLFVDFSLKRRQMLPKESVVGAHRRRVLKSVKAI